jgi:hypothetical protein
MSSENKIAQAPHGFGILNSQIGHAIDQGRLGDAITLLKDVIDLHRIETKRAQRRLKVLRELQKTKAKKAG